jgi:anti-sigma-K factor RskA
MSPADENGLHTLAGAYAMDAVGAADRARFEQHLAACAECREEIRGLREATARLGQATAVRPRGELRAATLRAAARIRQLPPVVTAQSGPGRPDPAAEPAAAGPAPGARPWAWRPSRKGSTEAAAAGPGRGTLSRLAGRPPRLALAISGLLAVAVLVLTLLMHGMQHQLDQAQRRSQAIAAVLNAGDVTRLTAAVRTGGTATVLMSHRQRALVFTAAGLRALPTARRYELWLMGPGGPRPAGMLPASRGMVSPMVVAGLAAGDLIGMTIEPASGSAGPTSPPVLLLPLGSR